MMRKTVGRPGRLFAMLVALALGLSYGSGATEGGINSGILWAGQTIDAGTVIVGNDSENLYLQATIASGWVAEEAQLALEPYVEAFPQNGGGLTPGQFPYKQTFDPPVTEFVWTIPLADIDLNEDNQVCIALHVTVTAASNTEQSGQTETAWLGLETEPNEAPGNNWGLYFIYGVSDYVEPCKPLEGYMTFTQGGWGSPPHGNNPGMILATLFDVCLPDGLLVGCPEGGFSVALTSAEAIELLLPVGGKPRSLEADYVDPVPEKGRQMDGGVLLGQTVALSLNVALDECLRNESSSDQSEPLTGLVPLADLIVGNDSSSDMTVGDVLDAANQMLGGCYDGDLSASQISDLAATINEAFDNGRAEKDCLIRWTLPGVDGRGDGVDEDGDGYDDEYEKQKKKDPKDPKDKPKLGDIDGNGHANNVDAIKIFNHALGNVHIEDLTDGDCMMDGRVNNTDAIVLFNWTLGNVRTLPLVADRRR